MKSSCAQRGTRFSVPRGFSRATSSMRSFLLLALLSTVLFSQQMDDSAIRSSVEAYRRTWQAMTPEQRKGMLDGGGATPEQYEQTLRRRPPAAPKLAGDARGQTDSNVGDMVRMTSEDLNRVRDANLIRLKDETCPAEIALELAALRSRSAAGVMPPRAALLELAGNWAKRPAAAVRPSSSSPIDVLLGIAPPEGSTDPARLNAEIERLLAACKR